MCSTFKKFDMLKCVLLLKALLRGFELASGLKIYFAKSQFGIIGGGVNWALEAANILHCTQLDYPFFFVRQKYVY